MGKENKEIKIVEIDGTPKTSQSLSLSPLSEMSQD
jgi:hypothetical protein